MCVTDTAGRIAIDASVRRGFAEMNNDCVGGAGRREELEIAERDTAKINQHNARLDSRDGRRRLLHQVNRSAVCRNA